MLLTCKALCYICGEIYNCYFLYLPIRGFPVDSDGKESAWNAGDLGLICGLGRSPGEGNGYPLRFSCLESSMDRGAGGLESMWSQAVRHHNRATVTL